ncbi:MAG: hypothetical protein D6781_08530 [Verrucomicrobia bacterium]|nr:MAG: hypothetical protein D6781_08530 [Verrucomicrobiota bacterium]
MTRNDEPPVIDLVPRSPFRWKVVIALVVAWTVVFILAVYTRHGMLRLLLPLIVFAFVVYLGWCFYVLFRRGRR